MFVDDFEEGRHGLLEKAMCGTRDAAQKWEMEHVEMMVGAASRQGSHSACAFYLEQKNIRVVVRGDDFAVLGASESSD